MSTTTTNYGFIKPEKTDPADITATNGNWDVIDNNLKQLQTSQFYDVYNATTDSDIDNIIDDVYITMGMYSTKYIIIETFNIENVSLPNGCWLLQINKGFMDYGNIIATHTDSTNGVQILHRAITGTTLGKWERGNPISYGTADLTAGTSELATGKLYFVYE